MNQPIHNAYWLSCFDSLLDSALVQHRAVSLIRVDLRFPEYMPATYYGYRFRFSSDFSFFESLKAKIQAYQRKNDVPTSVRACNHSALFLVSGVWQGKRQETLSRDITAQQRYRCSPGISPFLLRWRR